MANKVLGILPPARSITHVQQSSPSGPSVSANQQPVVSWANTVANVSPTWSWPGTSTHLLAQPPPTHAGLMLSPAAETFPKKIVEKAQSGQFMEMKELLADNMALISQLDTVSGLSTSHMFGAARPRLQEVTSLPIWCYCFMGYMALRTSDPATRDQLAYARLLIKEAQRHGGLGWLDYDRAFRQQAAADPSIRWNTLIPGLKHPQFWVSSRLAQDFSAHCAGKWTTPGASVHLAVSSRRRYPVQHKCKHPRWGRAGGDECAFHGIRGTASFLRVNVATSTNAQAAR